MGLPAKPLKSVTSLHLMVIDGPNVGSRIALEKEIFTIGRGEENNLSLADDSHVSRRHADIKHETNGIFIYNVSEKNYVLVNGITVEKVELKSGDQIQIGQSVFKVHGGLNLQPQIRTPVQQVNASLPPRYPQPQQQMQPQHQIQQQQQMQPQQQNIQNGPARNRTKPSTASGLKPFHYIVISVIGIALFLMSSNKEKNKKKDEIKTSSQIQEEMKISEDLTLKHKERLDRLENSELSPAYRSAQEYFTRAMREFYNGQYGRAIIAFQVVLNNDQNNSQARYYYDLARRKFDQQVKDHMKLGMEYREKKSWNKCQTHFSVVMVLLQNQMSEQRYKQAKLYFDECNIAMRGRY
ncbi:MAG TPA: FHA domain-containing protein [Pseudobdellovibrionaceae bacterium]|nr:FHA domain-containing protein [Pseudobdellovibrionaceae bacterium]